MAEQISISRDTLRAELSDLELRLVDRMAALQEFKANKTDVEALSTRITSLERFRYAWPSLALINALGAAVGAGLLIAFH